MIRLTHDCMIEMHRFIMCNPGAQNIQALKVDWPMSNLHSIKRIETRVCKNVSSKHKGRCRDGAVCTCKVKPPGRKP